MGDTRKLGASERVVGFGFKGERARDRADAQRQIEGLSQQDQMLQLLREQVAEQRRTNQLLEWLGGVIAQQRPPAD